MNSSAAPRIAAVAATPSSQEVPAAPPPQIPKAHPAPHPLRKIQTFMRKRVAAFLRHSPSGPSSKFSVFSFQLFPLPSPSKAASPPPRLRQLVRPSACNLQPATCNVQAHATDRRTERLVCRCHKSASIYRHAACTSVRRQGFVFLNHQGAIAILRQSTRTADDACKRATKSIRIDDRCAALEKNTSGDRFRR